MNKSIFNKWGQKEGIQGLKMQKRQISAFLSRFLVKNP
jgi:hypothetical protein